MAQPKGIEWIWPPIVDSASAQKASKQGIWASAWCAGVTILLVVLGSLGIQMLNFNMWALFDAFIFIVIGYGIDKMNRVAAVSGLGLYLLERIDMWATHDPKNPIIAVIISIMFINSIRGIFAYHKFGKETT